MKKTCFLILCAELFLGAYLFAATPDIRLSARKDCVLATKTRVTVLDVAETYLNRGDDNYLAMVEALETPYTPEEQEIVVADTPAPVVGNVPAPVPVVAAPIVYGDDSVLEAIATSFSKQVRGTLARGSTNYLQLQGGGLLKSGTSFPVKIPQIEGKSFTVTIVDIHSRGYTLKMGDASLTLPFDISSGVTKSSSN
jgi:hypothetical protein